MFVIIGGDQKHYRAGGAEEVRKWIEQGRADGGTLARREGEGEFKPLASFPEFADLAPPMMAEAPPIAETAIPPLAPSPLTAAQAHELGEALQNIYAHPPNFNMGECFRNAGSLLLANLGTLVGAAALVGLLDSVAVRIPFFGQMIQGALYGGLYLVYLRRIRGMDASAAHSLAGFGPAFMPLAMTGLISTMLSSLGLIFCFLPGIYLKVAWFFALPLIVDKGFNFWPAMEASRRISTRVWFKLFLLMVVVFAPFILAQGYLYLQLNELFMAKLSPLVPQDIFDLKAISEFLEKSRPVLNEFAASTFKLTVMTQFVWLANLPFATAVMMFAYEALFGTRKTPHP